MFSLNLEMLGFDSVIPLGWINYFNRSSICYVGEANPMDDLPLLVALDEQGKILI